MSIIDTLTNKSNLEDTYMALNEEEENLIAGIDENVNLILSRRGTDHE